MKIRTMIQYEEACVPAAQDSSSLFQLHRECVLLHLAEIPANKLKLAFYDAREFGKGKIYSYAGKLWHTATIRSVCAGEPGARFSTPLEALQWWNEHGACYSLTAYAREVLGRRTDRETAMAKARDVIRKFLLADGILLMQTQEPRYCVTTYGTGNNHGETLLSVSYSSPNNSFSALDAEKAVDEANRIAAARGDNRCIGSFRPSITVYMPELVSPSTYQ